MAQIIHIGAAGSPVPSFDDHFSPKIIVGNVPNGDPALASLWPFRYIPDPGDGSGIAQALLEASALGQQGDVYLRPGVYDFDLFGGALPLAIPDGTSLRGPAPGFPIVIGGSPSSGVLIRTSSTQRALFTLGFASSIRQLGIEVTTPAPGAVGSYVLDAGINGAPAFIDQVLIPITADDVQVANESLLSIIRGDFITVREVLISRFGLAPYRTGSLVGIDGIDPQLGSVQIQGLDLGVQAFAGTFVNVTMNELVDAMVFTGGGRGIRISDLLASVERNGILFSTPLDGSTVLTNIQLFGSGLGTSNGVGIEVQASPNGSLHLSNSRISGWKRGVVLEIGGAQLSNVQVDAEITGVDLIGAVDVTIAGCIVVGFGAPGSQGIFVRPGSDNVMISGTRVRGWDTGIDLQAEYGTIVASNLRFNTIPLLVLPAVSGDTEAAHNQV